MIVRVSAVLNVDLRYVYVAVLSRLRYLVDKRRKDDRFDYVSNLRVESDDVVERADVVVIKSSLLLNKHYSLISAHIFY